jgi:hypothetical protein
MNVWGIAAEYLIEQALENRTETTRVSSSWIAAVSYNGATSTLEVILKSGKTYSFPGASRADYEGFIRASSPGRYFRSLQGK